MKLEDLHLAVAMDFPINKSDLVGEAVRTSTLFIKYIKIYSDERIQMELMENKRRAIINEKREYYSGHADPEVYKAKPFNVRLKTEAGIQRYIDADEEVIKFDEKLIVQRQKVDVLVNCLDEIKRRGYAIKSAIDMAKFMSGG